MSCTRPLSYWMANSTDPNHQLPWPTLTDNNVYSKTENTRFPCARASRISWLQILRLGQLTDVFYSPNSTTYSSSTKPTPEQYQRRFNALAQQYIVAVLNEGAGAEADSRIEDLIAQARDILTCSYSDEDNYYKQADEDDENEETDGDENDEDEEKEEIKTYLAADRLVYVLRSWNTGRRGPGDCRRKCSVAYSSPSSSSQDQDSQQQQYQHTSYEEMNVTADDEAAGGVLYVPDTVSSLQPTQAMSANHIVIMVVCLFIVPMVVSVIVAVIISRRSKLKKDEAERKLSGGRGGGGDDKGKGEVKRGDTEVDPLTVSDSLPQPKDDHLEEADIELTPTTAPSTAPIPTVTEQTNLLEPDNVQIREEEIGDLQM